MLFEPNHHDFLGVEVPLEWRAPPASLQRRWKSWFTHACFFWWRERGCRIPADLERAARWTQGRILELQLLRLSLADVMPGNFPPSLKPLALLASSGYRVVASTLEVPQLGLTAHISRVDGGGGQEGPNAMF